MQDLTVIGIEKETLLVATDIGERYRIAVDEVLQSKLRQISSEGGSSVKVSPRDIQAQIRSGMSAEDVARSTGAALEDVERFEGPVLAERTHIVNSALKVAVTIASPLDPLGEDHTTSFGEVIEERLASLGTQDLRWASWKEESGWVVKLTFTTAEIDHDARWQYDPKRHFLSPLNADAVTLSQHGEIAGGLIPRLRVIDTSARGNESAASNARHASGDAGKDSPHESSTPTPAVVTVEPSPFARSANHDPSSAAATAAISQESQTPPTQNDTADLLEALRRRRGEREAASFAEEEPPAPVNARPLVRMTDAREHSSAALPLDGFDDESATQVTTAPSTPKRRRTAMPSWDEIVFGARSDEDRS